MEDIKYSHLLIQVKDPTDFTLIDLIAHDLKKATKHEATKQYE